MKINIKELEKTTGLSSRQIRRDLNIKGINYEGKDETRAREIFINHNYYGSISEAARDLAETLGKSESHMRKLIRDARGRKKDNEPEHIIGDYYLTL